MSYVKINIADRNETISGEVHGSEGDALVAALSAEPETIAELGDALSRFINPHGAESPFARFFRHEDYEPYDAGILIIDLAARVVACESTYCGASKQGEVRYHNGHQATDVPVRYRLPDDWLIVRSIPEYKGVARRRREERMAVEPLDARAVLYGRELVEFLVREMSAAENRADENLFGDVHERWLMTARVDLRGRTPREILFEKQDLVNDNLFSREQQWSFGGTCPPFLSIDAYAYRYAGFGTHEWVIYYEMVRFLLGEIDGGNHSIEDLERAKNDWLNAPDPKSHGKTPAQIVERERRRIPPAMAAEEALIDHDCAVCRMMSEDFETPMFWHLDGCNMDDRFAFSYHATREEYEAERREWEERGAAYRRKEDDSFFDENAVIGEEDNR